MKEPILRVLIRTEDVAKIEECSVRTASQRMNDIRVYFNKTEKRCKITFKEYATYVNIPLDDLEPYRLYYRNSAA